MNYINPKCFKDSCVFFQVYYDRKVKCKPVLLTPEVQLINNWYMTNIKLREYLISYLKKLFVINNNAIL